MTRPTAADRYATRLVPLHRKFRRLLCPAAPPSEAAPANVRVDVVIVVLVDVVIDGNGDVDGDDLP